MPLMVLDIDTLTLFLNGHEHVCRKINSTLADEVATTIITVEESLTGWYTRLRRARTDARLLQAFESLQVVAEVLGVLRILPFDAAALAVAKSLRSANRRIGISDLRIAAIVKVHRGVLITRNHHDFSQFPDLAMQDWSVPASSGGT